MSSPPADEPAHRSGGSARERGRALLGKGNAAIGWAKATRAGTLWTRLNAVDFINSAFQFATYALLCIFPFTIVVTAAAGASFTKVIIARLGLDPQAAKDVDELIASGSQALASLTVLGIAFLVLSGIGIATTCRPGTRRSTTSHRRLVTGCARSSAAWFGWLGYFPASGCTSRSAGRSVPLGITCLSSLRCSSSTFFSGGGPRMSCWSPR